MVHDADHYSCIGPSEAPPSGGGMFAGLSVRDGPGQQAEAPPASSGGGMFAGLEMKTEVQDAPASSGGMFAGLNIAADNEPTPAPGSMFQGLSMDSGAARPSIGGSTDAPMPSFDDLGSLTSAMTISPSTVTPPEKKEKKEKKPKKEKEPKVRKKIKTVRVVMSTLHNISATCFAGQASRAAEPRCLCRALWSHYPSL